MKLSRVLLIEVVAPLAIFYGLRAAGVDQLWALLAGVAIVIASGLHQAISERRIGGVRLFVLGLMIFSVMLTAVTGSPRALLIRSALGMAALGLFLLASLRARHPFLFTAAQLVLPADRQQAWQDSWDRHPAFRRVLWQLSAVWAAGCLLDAAVRAVLALQLPVDTVPAFDTALLVVTLAVLLAVQRFYGRAALRRHGLRLNGLTVEEIPCATRSS
jgi:uncharacterized membrane protein YfcA